MTPSSSDPKVRSDPGIINTRNRHQYKLNYATYNGTASHIYANHHELAATTHPTGEHSTLSTRKSTKWNTNANNFPIIT